MRLVRPVFHSPIRVGRRLESQPGARGVSGKAVVKHVRGSSLSISRKEGAPVLSSCLANVPNRGPLQAYAKLVLKGKIREDRHQVEALYLLQKVRFAKLPRSAFLRADMMSEIGKTPSFLLSERPELVYPSSFTPAVGLQEKRPLEPARIVIVEVSYRCPSHLVRLQVA